MKPGPWMATSRLRPVFAIVPDVSRADLERVAGRVEIGAVPDLAWLGA